MLDSKKCAALTAAALWAGLGGGARGATFTPGDVVVYRVGDGSAPLTSASAAVFLDEYSPAGALVQSIPLPNAVAGANHALTASGSATSEGLLNTSSDGRYLVFTGYDAAAGAAAVVGTASTTTARVVGRADGSGTVDTSTALNAYSANNIRSAASPNGTDLFITGANAPGVAYTTFGSTGTSFTQLSTTLSNIRNVDLFGGQLYVSTSSGSAVRVGTVGTGAPTTTGQTITNLPGFPVTGSPYQFVFADLSPAVTGLDTLYLADDAAGQIQKYSLVGGNWTLTGNVPLATVRGLTGATLAAAETLFATNGAGLFVYTDAAGYNVAPTPTAPASIATAAANTAFRGVDFAPVAVPEPTGLGLLAFAAAGLLARRRQS